MALFMGRPKRRALPMSREEDSLNRVLGTSRHQLIFETTNRLFNTKCNGIGRPMGG